jgi:AcrR family transcriptional regulator
LTSRRHSLHAAESPTTRRTQKERSDETIRRVVAAARELFGSRGFADTTLEEIAQLAGVSKGALFHHFDGKLGLFQAVFVTEQETLAATVVDASRRKRDPWDAFFAGCHAFLEASVDSAVQQITLLDAPAVLGWSQMRDLEAPYSFAILRAGITRAVRDGRLASKNPDLLSHLLLGALCEAIALVASTKTPQTTIRKVMAELRALLTP